MPRIPAVPALLALAAIALAAFALALSAGSVAIDPEAVLHALFATGDSTQQVIVRELRLPRAVAAFAAGGCLALAGALLQVLLRNSLADPYVLGVSGGAAAGALTMMLLGAGAWLVPAGAFGGALTSTAIVFGLARGRGPGRRRGFCSPESSSLPAGAPWWRSSCRSRPRRSCEACSSG